jgi:RimJ/RimL family protein N-acetyltransferase
MPPMPESPLPKVKIAPPGEPLTDGVVTLRLWRAVDAPAIAAACQDPEIPRWTRVPSPYAESDARAWLAHDWECWASAEGAHFAAVAAASDKVLGSVGIVDFEWDDHRAEIGYWVAPWARRCGVARRAVCLLCTWAFAELEIVRLEILPDVRNLASIGVARACGFTDEGVRRKYMVIKDELCDCVSFSLLKGEQSV